MAAKAEEVVKSSSNVSFSDNVEVIGTSTGRDQLNVSKDVENIGTS